MVTFPIYDEAGVFIAPPQSVADDRPMGPWDSNEDARPLSDEHPCSWCGEGRARTGQLRALGFRVSNTLCAIHEAEMDALNEQMPDRRLPQYRTATAA